MLEQVPPQWIPPIRVTPNLILNFHRTTHLVMNVAIGHNLFDATWLKTKHLKRNGVGNMSKISKILPATLFSLCPNKHKLFRTMWTRPSKILMKPCWPVAVFTDHYAQAMFGFSLDENTLQSSAPSIQQAANYRKLCHSEAKNTTEIAKEFRYLSSKELPVVSMELISTWLVP